MSEMVNTQVEYRLAVPGDRETLKDMLMSFKLLTQSVSPVYDKLDVEARKFLDAKMDASIRGGDHICLVASSAGDICGFLLGAIRDNDPIYAIRKLGHISDLFVTERHRQKGIGAALIAKAEAFFKARGIEHVRIETIVHYEHNREIYEKLGYQPFLCELRKPV